MLYFLLKPPPRCPVQKNCPFFALEFFRRRQGSVLCEHERTDETKAEHAATPNIFVPQLSPAVTPQIFLYLNFPRCTPNIFVPQLSPLYPKYFCTSTFAGWKKQAPSKSLEWSKTRGKPNRRTRDKPQWIVAQRPLSALTIPGSTLLVFQGFHGPSFEPFISLAHSIAPSKRTKAGAWLYTENDSPIKHRITSMDSDLEAFSRNPSDGSFAALSFLITAFTSCLNELFLSY